MIIFYDGHRRAEIALRLDYRLPFRASYMTDIRQDDPPPIPLNTFYVKPDLRYR